MVRWGELVVRIVGEGERGREGEEEGENEREGKHVVCCLLPGRVEGGGGARKRAKEPRQTDKACERECRSTRRVKSHALTALGSSLRHRTRSSRRALESSQQAKRRENVRAQRREETCLVVAGKLRRSQGGVESLAFSRCAP